MRTGTVGSGTVGQALAEYLGGQHQILISDPGYPDHADPLPADLDTLIVCVATPGVSHSVVTPDRGFGGACLSKDLQALLFCADVLGVQLPVLHSVAQYNQLNPDDKYSVHTTRSNQ